MLTFTMLEIVGQVVRGKIIDSHTKETLPGVNLYLPELKKGVVTDVHGNYILNLPRNGEYKLQVSFIGYDIFIKTITIENDLTLNIELHPAVIETKEFVVSSVYHSSQDENPVDVVQVDNKKLSQTASPTLMQQLTVVPGINIISTGLSIGKPVIRGLSFNRVLVYSDGVGLENQQFGEEHGLGLSEIGIEKVEVVKGPSSLFYGADAMGGVLHFITERPAAVNTIVGDFNTKYFSNTEGYSTNIGIKGASEMFRYRVRGGITSHSDYKQGNNARVTNTRFSESVLKAGLGFVSKWWSNDVNFSVLQTSVGIPEEIGVQSSSKNLEAPFQLINDYVITSQNIFYIKKSHINLNIGYIENNRNEYEEGKLNQSIYNFYNKPASLNMKLRTISYDFKWHLPEYKRVELIFGSQGKKQKNRNYGEDNLIPDAEENQFGGFLLVKSNWNKFTSIGGIRYDVKNIHGLRTGVFGDEGYKREFKQMYDSYNTSIGATYQLNEKWLFRSNFATGFRTPNLAELSSNGVHEGSLRYEIGNLLLKTEQNVELDFGVEYINEHVSFIVSGFNNIIHNYIYLTPLDSIIDDIPVYSYFQSDAKLSGLELTLDVHPHAMHWLHFETNFAMVVASKFNGEPLPRIPAHNVNNTIKMDFLKSSKKLKNSFFSISSTAYFAQNRISDFEENTSAYFLISSSVGTTIQLETFPVELSFAVSNLFNERYSNHLSRLKPNGIYDMGRNFMISLKVPFSMKGS